MVAGIALGVIGTSYLLNKAVKEQAKMNAKVLHETVQQAYKEGQESKSRKQRALSDQGYANKLCNAWWFGSSGIERKLVKP